MRACLLRDRPPLSAAGAGLSPFVPMSYDVGQRASQPRCKSERRPRQRPPSTPACPQLMPGHQARQRQGQDHALNHRGRRQLPLQQGRNDSGYGMQGNCEDRTEAYGSSGLSRLDSKIQLLFVNLHAAQHAAIAAQQEHSLLTTSCAGHGSRRRSCRSPAARLVLSPARMACANWSGRGTFRDGGTLRSDCQRAPPEIRYRPATLPCSSARHSNPSTFPWNRRSRPRLSRVRIQPKDAVFGDQQADTC